MQKPLEIGLAENGRVPSKPPIYIYFLKKKGEKKEEGKGDRRDMGKKETKQEERPDHKGTQKAMTVFTLKSLMRLFPHTHTFVCACVGHLRAQLGGSAV